jgi:23S rRNA (uracil1939-C5)-methyltransferase
MARAELTIDRLSKLGEGVASLDGRTVFVDGALPGERVVADVEPHGKVLRGELVKVLQKSAQRRKPACAVAGQCGGCDWLHASEALQREAKQEIVLSAIEHLGNIRRSELELLPPLASPRAMGYRRRAVFHFAKDRLALFGRRSHEQVAIDRCPALVKPLAELAKSLAAIVGPLGKDAEALHLLAEGDQVSFAVLLDGPVKKRHLELAELAVRKLQLEGAVLVPKEGSPQLVGKPVLKSGPLYLRPDAFAQANAEANPGLVDAAVKALGAGGNVLELYCGNGNFTFRIAQAAASVLGVESSGVSLELAQRSAREGGVLNVRFVQADATRVCRGLIDEGRRFDAVLLDPPRSGAAGIGEWAKKLEAKRVVYVACDPAALARDASELASSGFRPRTLQLVDMFPQTRHVEAVMSFERLS